MANIVGWDLVNNKPVYDTDVPGASTTGPWTGGTYTPGMSMGDYQDTVPDIWTGGMAPGLGPVVPATGYVPSIATPTTGSDTGPMPGTSSTVAPSPVTTTTTPAPTASTSTGVINPFTSGPFKGLLPDEVFKVSDPAAAYRNAMRQAGRWFNPYNRTTAGYLDWMGNSSWLNFMHKLATTGAPGGGVPAGLEGTTGSEFGEYLADVVGGQSPIRGVASAQTMLGDINSLLRLVREEDRARDLTPDTFTALELTPWQRIVAGDFAMPESQGQLFQRAYGMAAPALVSSLMRAMAPRTQTFEDYLEPRMRETPYTFLDLLIGSLPFDKL